MSSNLEEQIEAFYRSEKCKKLIEQGIKKDKNFGKHNGSGGTEEAARQCGARMKEILLEEISKLDSPAAIERFSRAVMVESKFVSGLGWTVDIYFDENEVSSKSLWWQNPAYEHGAYLPSLFNNGYSAKNYVYGENNHGEFIRSRLSRPSFPFIQNAVNRFNNENSSNGSHAECNEIYGGTLERGGLASIYF